MLDFIACVNCGASWRGLESDECGWCELRYLAKRERQRNQLLFPEWLGWGERYWRLREIDKRVWENTRGVRGDFVTAWQNKLFRAIADVVTDIEAAQALSRNAQWMIRMQQFAG